MSPRSAEANTTLHAERKALILDAALATFVERGYEGARMQEIADRCGLSYGLVYHYFESKEAVFRELVDSALGSAAILTGALGRGSSPAAFGAFASHALAEPAPHYFAMVIEALTKTCVPTDLSARAKSMAAGLKLAIAEALVPASSSAEWTAGIKGDFRAEALVAILLGYAVMKTCGLSDGASAGRAAEALAQAER